MTVCIQCVVVVLVGRLQTLILRYLVRQGLGTMADKELARVRSKFVDKVSKELINQLLDDILEDGVLNDGEKDSILEENNSRADKARRLIDTVKKKGDKASRKMIAHLQNRDPTLLSELGLTCGLPAPPVAEPQMKQEWSTTLIPATDGFRMEKQNDPHVYPVNINTIRSRVALLITNVTFINASLNRHGAEKDEESMEILLRALGYEVVKYRNLTAQKIDAAIFEFSKHPKLNDTDSVFVVIMSHGMLGAVYGVDSDTFPVNNIYEHLGSQKCPALLNKPKIIIIQACRGEEGGAVLVSDSANPAVLSDDVQQPGPSLPAAGDNIEDDTIRFVHKEKDFTSLLSSTPDTVSYRQRDLGSILIQYVVEVFNTFAHVDDIEELFRKVMQRFEDFSIQNRRQMPTKDRCTLTKRFYFCPGL